MPLKTVSKDRVDQVSSGKGSVLAVTTSIDALAVGFSLTVLPSILLPVLIIGLVTFFLCLGGVHLGHRCNRFGRSKVQAVGGTILLAIGIKILIEHLV